MAKQLAKKRFSQFSHAVFSAIERNSAYRWIAGFPMAVRWLFGIPVLLFGCLAWLTPIPGGFAILILAGAIMLPIKSFRAWLHRATHRSRVLSLYARWMHWRHRRSKARRDS